MRKLLIAPAFVLTLLVSGSPAGTAYADALAIVNDIANPSGPLWCQNVNGTAPDTGWAADDDIANPSEVYIDNGADKFRLQNGKLKTRDKTGILYANQAIPNGHVIKGSMKAKGTVGGTGKATIKNRTDKTKLKVTGDLVLLAGLPCHSGVGARPASLGADLVRAGATHTCCRGGRKSPSRIMGSKAVSEVSQARFPATPSATRRSQSSDEVWLGEGLLR